VRVAATRAALACVLCLTAALVLVPARASARGPALPVGLRAAALYVPATGQTLYADHAEVQRPIASTTKMMTALVTLQHVHDLDTVFAYPDYHQAADDSQIGLRPGDRMTVRDLVIAMMLPSADDAAQDLAENVGRGSVSRFISWMNADARRLGLRHTHFSTPIGLDSPGNYSTAADLTRLAEYDLAHFPFFARVVKLAHATLTTGPAPEVQNLNLLVGEYPWVTGVKTGHTSGAGWVLVAAGRRDGMRLISSALGVESDAGSDEDALALLDYGYAHFALRTPVRADEVVARLRVRDRPGLRVPVRAVRSWTRVLARDADVHVDVDLPRQLSGPLPVGAIVGSAQVRDGSRTLARVPIVLDRRLAAVSRLTIAARFMTRPWMLAILAIVVVGSVAVALLMLGGLPRAGRRRAASRVARRRRPRGYGTGWDA
jgi:D-alanyl-D-alanine carboxypeptidase (penicillin-binding protein 5/6)